MDLYTKKNFFVLFILLQYLLLKQHSSQLSVHLLLLNHVLYSVHTIIH